MKIRAICCVAIVLLLVSLVPAHAKLSQAQESGLMGEPYPYDVPRPRFATPVTIKELRLAFYKYSVVAIVRALCENNEENWNFVFDKVASGDGEWIAAFASYIAPGTDASTSTGVKVALAHALPNNPKAVLYLDRRPSGPSLHMICALPFIEPDYAFIRDYGERTLAALRQIDDPYLLDSRDVCVRRLQERLDHCEKVYKSGSWKN